MASAAMMEGCSGPVQGRDKPNKWLVTAAVVCRTLCIGVTMSMMDLAIPLMSSTLQTDIDTIQLFFYPIPIGLVSIGLALRALHNTRDGTRAPLDWGGWATLTPALTLLLLAVSQSQRPGWGHHDLLLLMRSGIVCAVSFALIERRQKTPLIEFQLFRELAFSAAAVVYCLSTFTRMSVSFAVIVLLQHGLDYSALQVGFRLLPAMLGRVAGELTAGHLSDRWGARGLCLAGLMTLAISSATLGRVAQQSSLWLIGALLILGNTGMALSNSPIIHAGLQTLRDERIGMGSGVLRLVRVTGAAFGVGVVGPVVAIAVRWSGGGMTGGSAAAELGARGLLSGYHNYFYLLALLIFCTMIPACLMLSVARHSNR